MANFKWYIIGDGVKREEIETKIKNSHLEEYVIMLGKKSNPYPYVKFADIMMHTSYIEAHCLTLLEAMCLHTPCVATRTNLLQDFVEDGINCFLAEQDYENQTECVLRLVLNTGIGQTLADNAFEMVCTRYSSSVIVSCVESII